MFYRPWWGLHLWDKINISSRMSLLSRKGLLPHSKNSLCESNVRSNVLAVLGGDLSMTMTLSCAHMTNHHISRELPYMLKLAISEWYSIYTSFSFHTLHIIIFGWWCHDATSTPNLSEWVWRSIKALREPMRILGVVRCNWIVSRIFSFYTEPMLGVNMYNVILPILIF